MKKNSQKTFPIIILFLLVLIGCIGPEIKTQHLDEIPSMLNILTNKAQIAVEEGLYTEGEEAAVLEYLGHKNPAVISWFTEHEYEIKIGVIRDIAVVAVCNQGKSVFEDTYCNPGPPDKDYRAAPTQKCEISLSDKEVTEICH